MGWNKHYLAVPRVIPAKVERSENPLIAGPKSSKDFVKHLPHEVSMVQPQFPSREGWLRADPPRRRGSKTGCVLISLDSLTAPPTPSAPP